MTTINWENNKDLVLFSSIPVGEWFAVHGYLYLKTHYDYLSQNAFNLSLNSEACVLKDTKVRAVDVEITVKD